MNKCKLQEFCQKRGWNLPKYAAVRDGADHNPRFTATVIVNGVPFETPKSQCRTSKEAQNLAAQLALDHLTSTYSPSPSASGVGFTEFGELHSQQENNGQAPRGNGVALSCEDDKKSKEELHMYKSRLQHYAQKLSLTLPAYSSEIDGPPHARRFRSKVTVGDKTYETRECFTTLKEAEHAAAKAAFESLSHDEIQEDESLYKILLQQLAQRQGLHLPTYSTTKHGPCHTPTFVATVEIGADVFQGQEAKTKKQAETRAAKVAYHALRERRGTQISPRGYNMNGVSEDTSFKLQPVLSTIDSGLHQDIANANPVNEKEADCSRGRGTQISPRGYNMNGVSEDTSLKLHPVLSIIDSGLHLANANPVNEKEADCSRDSKRYISSSSSLELNGHLQDPSPPALELNGHLQDPPPPVSLSSHDPVSRSTQSMSPDGPENKKTSERTIVYPRNSDMGIPSGASEVDFIDEKWVAIKVHCHE